MPIQTACDCGKRFQVEERHAGKRLACPGCGALLPIPAPAVAAAPAPPVAPGLVSTDCERHPQQPASAACQICHTAICRLCIREHGYFCSPQCKEQAQAQWAPAARDPQEVERLRRAGARARHAMRAALLLVVAVAGALLLRWLLRPQGELVWQTRTENLTYLPPLLDGERLLVPTSRKRLLALDPASGKTTAALELPAVPSPVPPLVCGKLVVVACGRSLVGCDLAAGRVVWRFEPPAGRVASPLRLGAGGVVAVFRKTRPITVDRQPYRQFVGPAWIHCVDPATGKLRWSGDEGLAVELPVCVGQGVVRFLERPARRMVWLDARTGRITRATATDPDAVLVAAGEGVVLQTETLLSCFDGRGLAWQRKELAYCGSGAGLVLAYTPAVDLLALEQATGKTRWQRAVDLEQPPMDTSAEYVVLRAQGKATPAPAGGSHPKAVLRRMQRAMAAGGQAAAALQVLRASDGSPVALIEPGGYAARLFGQRLIVIEGRAFFTPLSGGPLSFKEDSGVVEYRLPSGDQTWRTRGAGWLHSPQWDPTRNRLHVLAEFHPPGPSLELVPQGGAYWENQLYGFSLR